MDEKSHKNILIYDILYGTLIVPKPLQIRFDKIDGLIRVFDGTRYLTLFGSENMKLFTTELDVSLKSSIMFFYHYFAKIKVDSYDSFFTYRKKIDFV